MTDEELSKYMALIENYKEQLSQIETQYSMVQAAINDYNKAKITLEQLKNIEEESEVLLPIGGSTYIDAKAKQTSKVLFDIGSGIVTEKTCDDAIKKIEKRVESLQQAQEKLNSMAEQIQSDAAEVSNKAQKLLSQEKQ